MLRIRDVTCTFGAGDVRVTALNGISLSLTADQGVFACVIGQSGSGKTTLMSLLGGLDRPTSGSIEVNGHDIAKLPDKRLVSYRRREVGFVFQSYNLVPNLSAMENVMLPMEAARVRAADRRMRARALLEQVGLTPAQLRRKPGRLSGGQQQRVAIARALANTPKLILADEPTGNLDTRSGNLIIELLRSLSRSDHTTVIVVTHDLTIAEQADVVFRLQDGQLVEHSEQK